MNPSDPYCLTNCKEVIGDDSIRRIESIARLDAETGENTFVPMFTGQTYWDQVQQGMEKIVYFQTKEKRKARLERAANRRDS